MKTQQFYNSDLQLDYPEIYKEYKEQYPAYAIWPSQDFDPNICYAIDVEMRSYWYGDNREERNKDYKLLLELLTKK